MSDANEIIRFACKENPEAMAFCRSWVDFCHVIDDLWDKDKPLDLPELTGHLVHFILNVGSNKFYQAHVHRFESLIEQSVMAWIASEQVREKDSHTADVLKGFYHEVIFHAARICGGWRHGLDTAARYREYDFEAR